MPNFLNDEQQAQLEAMLQEESTEIQPPEETEAPEGAEADNEPETINETTEGMSEGDAAAEDSEPTPDPNAGLETEAVPQAPALPDGMQSVEQLIQAYGALKSQNGQAGSDMQALRDMNQQLVSIAEALGYGKELGGIDLSVDESLAEKDPKAYMQSQVRAEIAGQLKPLIEQQQKNLRGRLVDEAWRGFANDHDDVSDLMDDIREVMKDSPELYGDEKGLEVAYHLARSKRYTPEKAMMENDDFIGRAAANPKVREKVIKEYLEKVAKGGEDAPVTVGSGGKAIPAGPKQSPMTMEEAHKRARRMYNT